MPIYRAHRRFIGPNTAASPTGHPMRRGVILSKAKDPELVLSATSLTCHAERSEASLCSLEKDASLRSAWQSCTDTELKKRPASFQLVAHPGSAIREFPFIQMKKCVSAIPLIYGIAHTHE